MPKALNNGVRSRWPRTLGLAASLATATVLAGAGSATQAVAANIPANAPAADVKVEQAVRTALANGEAPAVLVKFHGKADLSAAFGIADRDARATYVYETLRSFADRTQSQTRQALNSQYNLSENSHDYTVLWIDNSIAISRLTAPMLSSLQASADIESIRTQKVIPLPQEPVVDTTPWTPNDAVSSLVHINVPQVWDLGYKGAGVVVANIDTGVRYTHQALVGKYRGNSGGGTFDHQYNWYDPYNHAATPRSSANHGSHTMGTMVGDGGTATTQIGAAPDAKWIACIGFGQGSGTGATDAGLIECGQWTLAPYPTSGTGTPDPTKHADIVNNSWGDCGQSYDTWYEAVIDGWIAAGVAPVFSNGNAPNCNYPNNPPLNTVGNPARSGKVLGVGSTGTNNGIYAPHSNKGPTDNLNTGLPTYPDPAGFPDLKPNVVAPGVNIYSSNNTSDTAYFLDSGTSMSAPATVGVIALMWSAAPCLHGNYGVSGSLLMSTATAIPVATGSPSDGPGNVPNQATGWGEINALAAVNAAVEYCASGGNFAPTLSKSFAPATIAHGTDSVLTIKLSNANAVEATLTSALTDAFPSGLVASATPAAATTCTSGTASATAGGTTVTLSSGAKIPASGNCTVTVSVTAASNGSYVNTIPAGALETDKGDNATAANATLLVNDTGAVFPAPYCPISFPSNVEPITHVVIGGIDNTTAALLNGTPELEDFTAILGTLSAGASASIAVEGNTDGNYATKIRTFIDWNHDGTFGAGESYDIGTITNSTGVDGQQATASIAVPATALSGNTRMRVTKKYNAFATACNTDGYGQAEDYTVNVTGSGTPTPTLAKAFAPASVAVDTASTLTITLGNPGTTAATLSANLVDTFPSGLVVATAPNASTTCGGTVTATAGAGSVTLSAAGSAIPASGSCTVKVDVSSAAASSYANTIAAGALQTDAGNNAAAANATLTVTGGSGGDPVINVTPTSLSFAVDAGASDSDALTIGNTGSGALNWTIHTAALQSVDRLASKAVARRALPLTSPNALRNSHVGSAALLTRGGSPLAAPGGSASPLGATQLSQTPDTIVAPSNSIACPGAENRLLRRFDFSEYPGAGNAIDSVDVGVQEATASQTLTVNLYTIPHGTTVDTIPVDDLTLIGSATQAISTNDDGTLINVPVTGTVADTTANDLVVEVVATEADFFIGATTAGETHPGFILAPDCGATEPSPIHDLAPDFANTNIIIVANTGEGSGDVCDTPLTQPWLTITPASGSTAAGASSDATVGVDATGLAAGDYHATICVDSNDAVTPRVSVPLDLTVTAAGNDSIFKDGFDGSSGGPFEQPLQDPSFEGTDGDAGSNPFWAGADSNDTGGGTPFYGDAARTGSFGAWGGGWHNGTGGTQTWSQSVTIASGGPRYINYWRNVVLAPVGTATLTISIDGTAVDTTDVVANGADADWTNLSVDISTYADNASHVVEFVYDAAGAEDGNLFVDDITIDDHEGSSSAAASTHRQR